MIYANIFVLYTINSNNCIEARIPRKKKILMTGFYVMRTLVDGSKSLFNRSKLPILKYIYCTDTASIQLYNGSDDITHTNSSMMILLRK